MTRKPVTSARYPARPRIGVGKPCSVRGLDGVVIGRHPVHAGWWQVRVAGQVSGYAREIIQMGV